jgi:hypothetical protein
MQARRDAIARPTATPACGATAARTWKWNGACRLPRNCPVSRRRRARPRRDRERTHGQKGHACCQPGAGGCSSSNRSVSTSTTGRHLVPFAHRSARQRRQRQRGPRRGCAGALCTTVGRHRRQHAHVGNLYVPTMALFTRGFARRRRSCSSGYSWNGWTERKGTCSSEHEACCAGWVPSDVLWSPRTLAAWLLMVMEGAGRQAV